ncbi:MAG: PAS domain S-box protein [Candidatus Methanoperedens sp.]|nr:PAS domain S-box protein [Candidatus Methanoperedens sp.]
MTEPIHSTIEKSEEYFKTIVESSFNGIAVTDEKGNFEYVNESFLKMTGWQREELIGKSFMKIIPGDMHESALNICNEVQEGVNNNHEIKIKTRDGKLKYLNSFHKLTEINGQLKTVSITEDITEKKILEQKLAESEARYKNFFDNASDSIYCYDTGGYFLDVNKTALELLGCTKEELIGTHISEWITPESLKTTQDDMKKRVGGEPGKDIMVLDVIDKEGGHHCMEIRRRITRQDDKIIVHGIGRDITERIKLEKELKESEAKYRDLFENANDAIFISDAEGYIISANNATIKAFGCNSKDEVIGIHFSDCLTPECIQDALDHKRKYLSGEPVKQPVVREVICKNGEHKWAEIICRVIKDGDRATGLHCIARDITEKVKMQRELKESEAKYRELFENAQDAMYILDTEGNILKMNHTGLRILGCTKEEAIGSNISKWLMPESLKIVLERRKKYLSGEKLDQAETIEIVCKGGEHRWVEIKARDIKNGGRRTEIHGIARDITEKMRLKQELMKSNKQKKLLCYLIEGTRGGKTRALILKHLADRSFNAHQLAKAMDMDYKTIRHHLGVLIKNGIITKGSEGYTDLYFLSKNIESNLNELNGELKQNKN